MSKFLLLLGPSGVGKSTLIKELMNVDSRFVYISPYITRPLREDEKDKIFVTNETMNDMANKGEFLVINEIYGIKYATPRKPIEEAFRSGKFPVLDWPIHKIGIMTDAFGEQLYQVYISPPSLEELKVRIDKDNRDQNGARFKEAENELKKFWAGKFDDVLDIKVVNKVGQFPQIAKAIYLEYMRFSGEGNINPNKEKL